MPLPIIQLGWEDAQGNISWSDASLTDFNFQWEQPTNTVFHARLGSKPPLEDGTWSYSLQLYRYGTPYFGVSYNQNSPETLVYSKSFPVGQYQMENRFISNLNECEDERTVASGYRITINGLNLFGDPIADMFDVPAEDHWLPEGIGWSHISVFKTITRVVIRPLNGVSSGGSMTLLVRRYQAPNTLAPAVLFEQLIGGFSQDLPVCTVNFSKCAINGDYSFTGAGLDNLLFQRFTNLKIEVTGLEGANDDICCDDTNDTGQEDGGGEEPIQEPYFGQECCDALWVYVYKLESRINTLEIKMTEIADGLQCICDAIQALNFSPVIEVKPADSVNEINLPEIQPIINIAPCEPTVTIQAATPINQINLPEIQPVINIAPCEPTVTVQAATPINQINLPEIQPVINISPCEPTVTIQAATPINQINLPEIQPVINVEPCTPVVNNVLEDVRINGGVDIRLENLEAIQTAIMAALSCNGINITCVIAGLLEKLQTMIDNGALDLDKYFLQDEKNLLKILRELLTTTDPCINQEKTISELIQEKEMVVFVENEQDIRTVEDRSINKCCPTAEK